MVRMNGRSKRWPGRRRVVQKLPELELPEVRVPPPTRDDVMAAYRRVYGSVPDARENQAVGKRLADLEMQVGEERDAAGENAPYHAAIALYEDLLKHPDGQDLDQIVYQLARAYDVVGDDANAKHYLDRLIAEYPDSPYVVEARFRRGEMAFSADQYATGRGRLRVRGRARRTSTYWQNANYMLGWCRFKESQLDEALNSFFVGSRFDHAGRRRSRPRRTGTVGRRAAGDRARSLLSRRTEDSRPTT